jgi:hypothetical protein
VGNPTIRVTANKSPLEYRPWQQGWALPREWSVTISADNLPYMVELAAALENGRPQCKTLTMRARRGSLHTRQLRHVPVVGYLRLATAAVALPCDDVLGVICRDDFRSARGGRPPLTDEFLSTVVAIYRRTGGRPAAFRQAVSSEIRPVASSTLDGWVRTARSRGLL